MADELLLRYARHVLLDEIGIGGVEKMANARVLQIGAGGLGSAAALYLAASGVNLTIADNDCVELSNLQRQIIHTTQAIGKNKAESAKKTLVAINPTAKIVAVSEKITDEILRALVPKHDLILDCSDNFPTRYAINRAALEHKKPLVAGAAIQFAGQVFVSDFQNTNAPCYSCVFDETAQSDEIRCADSGVFAPIVGVIGTLQAGIALKIITGLESPPFLLTFDFKNLKFQKIKIQKDAQCAVCKENPKCN